MPGAEDPLYGLDGLCRSNGWEFRVFANTGTDCAWEAVVVVLVVGGAFGDGRVAGGGRSAGAATADTAVAAAARAAIVSLRGA